MNNKNILTSALLIGSVCTTGCISKDNPSCNEALVPQITANTSVTAGSALSLSVSGIDNVFMYNWHGPNGFSSHEESPVVPNMSGATAGRYTVDVITKDGCVHTAVTDSVIVGGAQPACTIANNRAELASAGSISFSYISGVGGGGAYNVTANGSGGDMHLEFNGASKPLTGVYGVESLGGFWSPGYVRLNITAVSSYWYPAGGKVNVSVVNGKTVISFCNLDFTSQTYGTKSKGSAQITLP